MDDDTRQLLNLLCTRIGMSMEDASMIALKVGSLEGEYQAKAVHELNAAAARIYVLAQAVAIFKQDTGR